MKRRATLTGKLILAGFSAALLAAVGCNSSGGDGGSTMAALACSDGGPAAVNAVTMNCGGASDSSTEVVAVTIGGPAAGSTTLRGLNFDVTYDPSKLEFVHAGNYASSLFPGALIAVAFANGQPGRVLVSIQQTGGAADVGVATGPHMVLSLSFRRAAGATFGPTPLMLENVEATTASAAIAFASSLALSYQ